MRNPTNTDTTTTDALATGLAPTLHTGWQLPETIWAGEFEAGPGFEVTWEEVDHMADLLGMEIRRTRKGLQKANRKLRRLTRQLAENLDGGVTNAPDRIILDRDWRIGLGVRSQLDIGKEGANCMGRAFFAAPGCPVICATDGTGWYGWRWEDEYLEIKGYANGPLDQSLSRKAEFLNLVTKYAEQAEKVAENQDQESTFKYAQAVFLSELLLKAEEQGKRQIKRFRRSPHLAPGAGRLKVELPHNLTLDDVLELGVPASCLRAKLQGRWDGPKRTVLVLEMEAPAGRALEIYNQLSDRTRWHFHLEWIQATTRRQFSPYELARILR